MHIVQIMRKKILLFVLVVLADEIEIVVRGIDAPEGVEGYFLELGVVIFVIIKHV